MFTTLCFLKKKNQWNIFISSLKISYKLCRSCSLATPPKSTLDLFSSSQYQPPPFNNPSPVCAAYRLTAVGPSTEALSTAGHILRQSRLSLSQSYGLSASPQFRVLACESLPLPCRMTVPGFSKWTPGRSNPGLYA